MVCGFLASSTSTADAVTGPIVRINPRYIHINDPDFYDEIYAGGRRTNKDMWFMNSVDDDDLQMNGSTFQTMSHDQHKLRRGAVNQFFSKRSVRSLDSLLQEKVAFLMGRFHQHLKDGTILNLSDANSALTMDVISAYCFGTGVNVSTQPEYGRPYRKLMNEATQMNVPGRHFPTLFRYLQKLPVWIQLKMMPEQALMFEFNDKLQATINNIASGKQGSNFASSDAQHRTIFHQIVESDLPPKEKTPRRLFGESVVFMGAGTETTARTLSVTAFYILHTPGVLPKLLEELNRVMPTINSPVAATDIESLPWLVCLLQSRSGDLQTLLTPSQTGCIHEGLRLAHGVPGRAPRIQPEHELRYKEWIIPRGVSSSSSICLYISSPSIY